MIINIYCYREMKYIPLLAKNDVMLIGKTFQRTDEKFFSYLLLYQLRNLSSFMYRGFVQKRRIFQRCLNTCLPSLNSKLCQENCGEIYWIFGFTTLRETSNREYISNEEY